jgi:signal transduction histidine kinase
MESPWYFRAGARIGLEGKILIAVMMLLIISLAATSWIWVSQTQAHVAALMGEQDWQIAHTLSLASKQAMESGRTRDLIPIGNDLVKARNILFVAFYDAKGNAITASSARPDPGFQPPMLQQSQLQSLSRVQYQTSLLFGDYLEVCAPVLTSVGQSGAGTTKLLGYITVGVSPAQEQRQVTRVNYFATATGCIIVLLSLPIAFVLVHRIFTPIRQLVVATHKIAEGDLDAQVDIDRRDAIGTLARSFNEMSKTVKRQQQDLQAANRGLEWKVAQRTEQLEKANHRLSNEIAEKEDFLRAVSHDLNAPLRNISGMAAMLLMKHREKFDEDIVHRLERIQKNVEVETDLIGELLELSRIKTRRHRMELVEITALVRELEGMFESDLKTKHISLVLDCELPVLNGEKARFRQIFQNLIDNSIKYMGDGPLKEIHLGCALEAHEAEFYVRDTGIGIDPEDIAKVFFVFRRGKNSATCQVAGKGVGLSSVKSIIETYGGAIRVESALGNGSTFTFTISGQYVPALAQGAGTSRLIEAAPDHQEAL